MNLDEMRKNELLMINKASLSLDDVVSDILRFGYKISDVYSELSLIFEDNLKKCLEYCKKENIICKNEFLKLYVDILRRGFVFNKDDYQDWDFIVNLSMGYGKNKYVYLICNAISYLLTGNEVNVDKKPVIDLLLELVNSFNGIDSFEEIKRAANVKLLCVELIKYLNFSGIDKIEEIDKIEDFVLKTVISSTNTKDTVIKTSSLANYYWVKYISKKNMSKHIRNIYLSGNAYIACQFLSDIEDIKKVDNELLIEAINKNTYPNEARIMFEHISSVKLRKLSRGNTKGKK